VDHLRLDFLGQGVKHACGNVCIELNQEDRDRLGMFVADQRHQRGVSQRASSSEDVGCSGAIRCIRLSAFTSPTARVIIARTVPTRSGTIRPSRSVRSTNPAIASAIAEGLISPSSHIFSPRRRNSPGSSWRAIARPARPRAA
jgi:hypothetical protein